MSVKYTTTFVGNVFGNETLPIDHNSWVNSPQ